MRKKFVTLILVFAFCSSCVNAEENYDPQHTMLALNMAIVSVNKILTTESRAVLE